MTALAFIGAGVAIFFALWWTVLGAALGRLTRTEASQAFDSESARGRRLMFVESQRDAATAGLAFLRLVSTSLYAYALGWGLAQFMHGRALAGVFLLVTLVVCCGFMALRPLNFGVRRHIRVLKSSSGMLVGATRFGRLFIRTPAEPVEARKAEEQKQEDQLALMVERVSESEAIEEGEREILESLFDMSETMVREIMVPRTDMITVSADTDLDSALSLFVRSGFSRIPVMGDNLDDLRGMAYMKDVIRRIHRRSDAEGVTVSDIMRPPVLVPETKNVGALMRELQAQQVHIAVAIDEYGAIAGLVTIEDIVEELVGEIEDEHDHGEPETEDLGRGAFRVPARCPVDELGELFGLELNDDDVDTAGGLLTKGLGRLPIRGSETTIAGLHLVADRFEGRRHLLSTVIATRAEAKEEEHDA
ncbi:hemolysin family protein [Neoactinobaculum massilliense]|uniref:hemolysin family protein n=1 Tax=Neoactinobaculum massilliense TaxID=2364794 RepID=UPI000F52A2C9|nr:hemolysin family protein [Neoactinobaculum massilliense]